MNSNPLPKAQAPAWAFAIEPMPNDRYALFQGGDLSLVTITDLRSFLDQEFSDSGGLGGDPIH
jgi:hypothetical protein